MNVNKKFLSESIIIGHGQMRNVSCIAFPTIQDIDEDGHSRVRETECSINFTYRNQYNEELLEKLIQDMRNQEPFEIVIHMPDQVEWVYPNWVYWKPKPENEVYYRFLNIGYEKVTPIPPSVIPMCSIKSVNKDTGEVEIASSWFKRSVPADA